LFVFLNEYDQSFVTPESSAKQNLACVHKEDFSPTLCNPPFNISQWLRSSTSEEKINGLEDARVSEESCLH
jgi:23S rRNA A1618 N6-methylase RlmF